MNVVGEYYPDEYDYTTLDGGPPDTAEGTAEQGQVTV